MFLSILNFLGFAHAQLRKTGHLRHYPLANQRFLRSVGGKQYGADQLARAMLVIQYALRAKNVGADREPIWNLVITFHIARYLAPPFRGQYSTQL